MSLTQRHPVTFVVAMTVNGAMMTIVALTLLNLVPRWVVLVAFAPWALIVAPWTVLSIIDNRRTMRFLKELRQTPELQDLSPELQEEIQITWARRVLRNKGRRR